MPHPAFILLLPKAPYGLILSTVFTVLFTTVWDMITMLQQSRADYSYQKQVQWYTKPDLLILDELG
jgi:DNA replication protein DnaC